MHVPTCPFCASHRLTVTDRTEHLTYKCCDQCYKRWAEANVAVAVVDRCGDGDERANTLGRRAAAALNRSFLSSRRRTQSE